MKRSRSASSLRLSRDGERLIALSLDLNAAASRIEDRFWESQLDTLVSKLLRNRNDACLESALDHLFQRNPPAYDVLIETVEAAAESFVIEHQGSSWQALLLAAPVIAWTRYQIPSGPLRGQPADNLRVQWQAHLLAHEARFAMVPYLYSVDQLPRSFAETHALTSKLAQAALAGQAPRVAMDDLPETAQLLADTRYLVGVAVAPVGQPLLRWQEPHAEPHDAHGSAAHAGRTACLEQWIAQAKPNLAPLLPGCGFELLLPDAYYVNCREADRLVRPYSLKAAVGFLESQLRTPPADVRAVIAGVGEQRIDEYRIGFTQKKDSEVIYGVTWPLFGREDENAEPGPVDEIVELLKELGVSDIRKLSAVLPPEFCDDCGAPYFPDPSGDMVHAELPDEVGEQPAHFH
jgi:hypothetical protein